MPDAAVGLQLYSISDMTERDMIGAIERVAEIGYEAVEFAGYGGCSAKQLRAVLDRLGMWAVGSHLDLDEIEARPNEVTRDLLALGCEYGIVPWLEPALYASPDAARRTAMRLAGAAATMRRAGLKFAYHNHDFEFKPIGSTTLWHIILDATDPDTVGLEVDVYWARRSGLVPAQLISECGSRVALVHAKDTSPVPSGGDCPVGEGIEDWPAVIAACRGAGVKCYIVEQEQSADMLADLARSLSNVRRLLS